jgi:hypothetical protein
VTVCRGAGSASVDPAGFTGGVSDSPPAAPDASPAPPAPPARRPWSAWAELRTDLRAALGLALGLALAGVPAGLLWWWLAPRAGFRITADGPVAVGNPSAEIPVANDGVLALVLAGLGLLAGVLAWRLRRRRGLATLLALALGTVLAGVVAWRLGAVLAPPPTRADLGHIGSIVSTGLSLHSLPVLAVGPFAAVLAYLVPAAYSATDDLGRVEPPVAPPAPPVSEPEPASTAPQE